MASVTNTARLSARVISRYAQRPTARRGFRSARIDHAAQNYPMPALSPTMTEGNIASWRVKEGDSFSAGDVLLEIETDKATMDVEAQDDGILMKIVSPDGSKGVKVGERIAVTAEPGDDINSLEMPTDNASKTESKPLAKKEMADPQEKKEASKPDQSDTATRPSSSKDESSEKQGGKPQKQKYPLYPSVEHLLHQNGLSSADADQIAASGPNGRLLKGDVLAYLGRISKAYPAQSSERLQKLSHLDLSNIQLAPKPEPKKAKEAAAPEPELPAETEIAIPISLSSVIATQKRVHESLGIHLPLSVFIARASELANEDLPLNKNRKPTSDDLFTSVLGLDKIATKSSKGTFFPQIAGLGPTISARPTKKPDIIDILSPKAAKANAPVKSIPAAIGITTGENIFSIVAASGEEKRAAEYLERMKLALEKEPGRLVL